MATTRESAQDKRPMLARHATPRVRRDSPESVIAHLPANAHSPPSEANGRLKSSYRYVSLVVDTVPLSSVFSNTTLNPWKKYRVGRLVVDLDRKTVNSRPRRLTALHLKWTYYYECHCRGVRPLPSASLPYAEIEQRIA